MFCDLQQGNFPHSERMSEEGLTTTDIYALVIFHVVLGVWNYRLVGVLHFTTGALNECAIMAAMLKILTEEERRDVVKQALFRMFKIAIGFLMVASAMAGATYFLLDHTQPFQEWPGSA